MDGVGHVVRRVEDESLAVGLDAQLRRPVHERLETLRAHVDAADEVQRVAAVDEHREVLLPHHEQVVAPEGRGIRLVPRLFIEHHVVQQRRLVRDRKGVAVDPAAEYEPAEWPVMPASARLVGREAEQKHLAAGTVHLEAADPRLGIVERGRDRPLAVAGCVPRPDGRAVLVELLGHREFLEEPLAAAADHAPHVAGVVHVHERHVAVHPPGLVVLSGGELAVAVGITPNKGTEAGRLMRRPRGARGAEGQHGAGNRHLIVVGEPQHVQRPAVLGGGDEEPPAMQPAHAVDERRAVDPRIVGKAIAVERRRDPLPVARRRLRQIDPVAVVRREQVAGRRRIVVDLVEERRALEPPTQFAGGRVALETRLAHAGIAHVADVDVSRRVAAHAPDPLETQIAHRAPLGSGAGPVAAAHPEPAGRGEGLVPLPAAICSAERMHLVIRPFIGHEQPLPRRVPGDVAGTIERPEIERQP